MSALRLEVETHIVTASATAVQNLTKCVAAAGVKIDELVVDSLASAEAVLSETEKELGVAVADIGAGTIDLALFQDGSPFHTRVLPVGGANVTNDVAIGLKTSIQVAEELKISHGTCDLRAIDEDEQISVSVLGEDAGRTVSRLEVSQIIEARMRETFELLRNEIRAAGVGMLPAGIILTGGARAARGCRRARSRGPPDAGPHRGAGRDRRPRRHPPQPELQHRRRAPPVGRHQPDRGRADPLRVGAGRRRPRPAARRHPEHLPVETRELTVRTGNGRGLFDLTGECAAFAADASAGEDGLLSVFVPHATAGLVIVEIGAGSDDDLLAALDRLLPREERLYRHRHGSPGPRRRPRPAAPRAAVADRAGRRRRLALGTWQSICLLDPNADNAIRTVRLSFLPADRSGGRRSQPPQDRPMTVSRSHCHGCSSSQWRTYSWIALGMNSTTRTSSELRARSAASSRGANRRTIRMYR